MPKRKVTSKDVAEAAGVSQTTVSFVLNDVVEANISESTRHRVLHIARELGYVPNVSARSLVQGRSNNVGIALIHPHEQIFLDSYIPNALTGLGRVIQEHGFRMIVERVVESRQYDVIVNLLRGHEVAGMIVHAPRNHPALLREICEQDTPVVVLGNLRCEAYYAVSSENLAGVRNVLQHVVGLGHRRIACISYAPEGLVEHAGDRLETYYQTLEEAGITPDRRLVRFGEFDPQTGYDAMQDLLAHDPLPTAVFGMNDMMAIGAIAAIRDAGLRVPEDVAVVGFDDDRFAAFTNPPLTTVREAQRDIGLKAGQMLIDLINGIEPAEPQLSLPTQLIIRKSCGALWGQQ